MNIVECLNTVIGLSRNDELQGYKEEYANSDSGLFLDELQGVSLKYCGEVWDMMEKARENAIRAVVMDVSQEAQKYIESQRKDFTGLIGTVQFVRSETTKGFYGCKINTSLNGAIKRITGITFLPFANGDVTLNIYNDFELLKTVPVNDCIAKRPKTVTFDEVLELSTGNSYFIIEGATAYKAKLACCGTTWCFNTERPCYNIHKKHWSNWVMVGGITGAVVDERTEWKPVNLSYGIILHASFSCNKDELLCSEYSDFQTNEVDRSLAFAIQYKTGEIFLSMLMDSGEVNRFTLLGSEALEFNREHYNNRYAVMVDYVVKNLDINRSDCYVCKTISKMTNRFR